MHANVADQTAKKKFPGWDAHACDDGHVFTAPAGSFRASPFGLYDLLGNATEWCEDTYRRDAYSSHARRDPLIREGSTYQVVRGGTFYYPPEGVRCAHRGLFAPGDSSNLLGFRLVRD